MKIIIKLKFPIFEILILVTLLLILSQPTFSSKFNNNYISRSYSSQISNADVSNFNKILKNYKMNTIEAASFSQSGGIVQHKLDFDVEINMEKHIIEGYVRIHYKCLKSTNFIGLDIRDLLISNVKDAEDKVLSYHIIKNTKNTIGDGLIVKLTSNCISDSYLDIYYSTQPNSLGIHFSDPSVLHNKNKAITFLYTHGEAIYSRTFFPSQDTPSLKIKASAKIRIQEPYTVLFSGELTSRKKLDSGLLEYSFTLDKPIPTYLITFTAGVIQNKQIPDSRCEVWGETEALKWVDESFKHCEDYLKFYETYKPFQFKKMVFLVVPGDFPFSGMENPFVTYISESVLSKDMSLSKTIAHEIVHFWSGNLVTNKNWVSFWLNEGITTYLNRKAFRVLHGDDTFFFELYGGLFKLDFAIKELKKNTKLDSSFRSLYPKIINDPYITFSRIPYEKGSFFLYYIETLVGDKAMHNIMSDYFNEYEFKSLDSDEFLKFLRAKILKYNNDGEKIIDEVDWNEWMHGTEMIPVDLNITSNKNENFKKMMEKFKAGKESMDEIKRIFTEMKISEQGRVLKELNDNFTKLNDKAKIQIKEFLENKELFNEHVIVTAHWIILQGHFISDTKEREKHLIDLIENLKYYKVQHLRQVFGMLKEINSDKKYLIDILNRFKIRFNPLTVARLLEFIEIPFPISVPVDEKINNKKKKKFTNSRII